MLNPGTKFPENRDVSFAGLSYGVLSTKTSDDFYGGNYQGWHNMGIFGAHQQNKAIDKNLDSEVCSPPLWRTSPPRSPQHRRNHYRSLSPSSRAEAIARGQKELMDMVSRMPEGCYELSLKDIVEHPINMIDDDHHVKDESFSEARSVNRQEEAHILRRGSEKAKKKKIEKKAQMNNATSIGSINNGGFLLKMVFPISIGSRKKKIRNGNSTIMVNNSFRDGRASPKPLLAESNESGKSTTVDEEWWKNRFSESGDSESVAGLSSSNSGSSKSSGSSSSRSSSRNYRTREWSGGCWPSIFSKKGKRAE